jgi:7-carboxy-7-deazaguanine synthase
MFLVAEEFVSINGEGLNAGVLAHFIRLAGCPLSCSYCDTAWAQTKCAGKPMSCEEIVALLDASSARFITLTGGEPLAAEGIETLIEAILNQTNKVLEIETSGAIDLAPFIERFGHEDCLRFTVDYKLGSSGMMQRMILTHYSKLRVNDVIKYVIGSEQDLEQAIVHIGVVSSILKGELKATPIFSPVYGKIDPQVLVEAVKTKGLSQVRIQLQLHKYIWEPTQQGV